MSSKCMLFNLFHLLWGFVRRTFRSFFLFAMLFRIKLVETAGQVQDERNKAKPNLVLLVACLDSALLHPLDKSREEDEVCTRESLLVGKHLEKLVRHPLFH